MKALQLALIAWSMTMTFGLEAPNTPAQTARGDIILGVTGNGAKDGRLFSIDRATGAVATIVSSMAAPSCVRMAPDNVTMVVPTSGVGSGARVLRVLPQGIVTTQTWFGATVMDMDLDENHEWICVGLMLGHGLFAVDDRSGIATTISRQLYSGMAIVRESGFDYVTSYWQTPKSQLFATDRRGVISTLFGAAPALGLLDVELRPQSGDLILGGLSAPEIRSYSPAGRLRALGTFASVRKLRVDKDDTLWAAGSSGGDVAVMRFDLQTNTILTIHRVQSAPSSLFWASALDIYGNRPLHCERILNEVHISVRPDAAALGASYQLAASFGRRPGVQFSNGNLLSLDVTDPLFAITATSQASAVFFSFFGYLTGPAQAVIRLPQVPRLGLTVFVSGVYLPRGAAGPQTLNTHWFVL